MKWQIICSLQIWNISKFEHFIGISKFEQCFGLQIRISDSLKCRTSNPETEFESKSGFFEAIVVIFTQAIISLVLKFESTYSMCDVTVPVRQRVGWSAENIVAFHARCQRSKSTDWFRGVLKNCASRRPLNGEVCIKILVCIHKISAWLMN